MEDNWLEELPPAMKDALALVAKATIGMSEREKSGTANWLLGIYKDEGAPPAVRELTRSAYQLVGAAMIYADGQDSEGHIDRVAKVEKLMRTLREGPKLDR